jgi:hypothetical protein
MFWVELIVGLCAIDTQISFAAPIGYSFSGVVSYAADTLPLNPPPPPYGIYVPSSAPFSGFFYFDPGTAPISAGTGNDSSIYPQFISGGFTATIGNMTVRADSYAIEVSNNISSGNNSVDQFSIIYWNGLTVSPPVDPLVVNGTSYAAGHFRNRFDR